MNGFFSRTQADERWRRAWGLGDVRAGYHANQGLIYSQPLLDHPELDKYTQHNEVVLPLLAAATTKLKNANKNQGLPMIEADRKD